MNHQTIRVQVESIAPLTDSIIQLVLVPEVYTEYQAGQYLQIHCPVGALSYSIANAPLGSHKYEFHIRHSADNSDTQCLFDTIKKDASALISLPYGECSLNRLNQQKPILFIAGGTGFAPINAMIEQLLADSDPRSFELFWGARSKSDLYLEEKVIHWQKHVSHFKYFSLLSDENKNPLLTSITDKHPHDLNQWQIVLSGPFDMVYSIRDVLLSKGVSPDHLFSDAFSFEGI